MNNPLYWSTWSWASTTNPDSLTVWHNDMLFDFKTGVRQRCMMSEVLFNLAIDLVNRKKDNKRFLMRDLRAFSHLANNLALNCLTHTCTSNSPRQDQQTETYWQQVGLQISTKKTETIVNMDMPAPIKANLEKLRQADYGIYLGSIIKQEGAQRRTSTADWARPGVYFEKWTTSGALRKYSTNTKLKLYQAVLYQLSYMETNAGEWWRPISPVSHDPSHTKCLIQNT